VNTEAGLWERSKAEEVLARERHRLFQGERGGRKTTGTTLLHAERNHSGRRHRFWEEGWHRGPASWPERLDDARGRRRRFCVGGKENGGDKTKPNYKELL